MARTARVFYRTDRQLHSRASIVYCLSVAEVIRWKAAIETRSIAGLAIRTKLDVHVSVSTT